MIVLVVTPPAAPVVDLDTAKAHLNIEVPEFDDLVETYVAAATGTIDGPDGWLGRALGVQTLEARLDGFPCEDLIALPCGPLIEILSIKYDDAAGVEQTLALGVDYTLDPAGALLGYGKSWGSTRSRRGSVRIRYRAGYDGAATPALPKPITAAILLMTGDLFASRETFVTGTIAAKVPMSTTAEHLLAPFRVWGF